MLKSSPPSGIPLSTASHRRSSQWHKKGTPVKDVPAVLVFTRGFRLSNP